MAKQHDLIIDKMIVNYLKDQLDEESLICGNNDLSNTCGIMGLCKEDKFALLRSVEKKLKPLQKRTNMLSDRKINWMDDLTKYANDNS